jgi:hypothetical protein
MRPHDRIFLGEHLLPGWLRALVRQLPDGGAEAPPAPFAVVPLLQELVAITDGIAQGKEPPFPQDRASLNHDIQQALSALGTEAAKTGGAAITEFRKNDLTKLLDQPAGAKKLRATTQVLIMDLASPDGRAAAWQDCVDAFAGGRNAGECESKLRHLSSLFEAAGFDWAERAKAISEVISLSTLFILPSFDPEAVSVDDRLADAETVIRDEITVSADTVVWVAFANAAVADLLVVKGPLEFYDSRIWSAVLSGTWPGNPTWVQPLELADPQAASCLSGLPADDFVMARLSLPNAPLAEVRDRARDLAQAAAELAGAERPSEWVLLDGAAAFTGDWWGSAWFSDPRDAQFPTPALMSPVASGIGEIDDDLVRRIAIGDSDARDLVTDLRWFKNTTTLRDGEQRLALLVSLIERLLVPAAITGDKWYGAAQHYFEYLLAFDEVQQAIWDATYYGVNRARRNPTLPPSAQQVAASLVKVTSRNTIQVDLREGIRQAAALLPYVDPESVEVRMLNEVVQRTSSGASAAAWIEEARADVERLLARARRQRNGATHGTRTIPSVVASVEPFLTKLVGRLIGAQHLCVEQHLDLIAELERWRLARIRRTDQLRGGGAPDALLID